MSSFYKSNLINGYDSLLIPSEKDPKKDVESNNLKGDMNVNDKPFRLINYPYKRIIEFCQILACITSLIFVLFWAYILFPSSEEREKTDNRGQIIPEKFYDPCNSTNVIPLNAVEKIKCKIAVNEAEINGIKIVARYNISVYANEYLSEKLTNLTNSLAYLKQQYEEQKEIRYICYKKNLEKLCERESLLYKYQKFSNVIHFFICIFASLILIPFFFLLKAKKMKLTPEQEIACDSSMSFLMIIVVLYIFMAGLMIGTSVLIGGSLEIRLKWFQM